MTTKTREYWYECANNARQKAARASGTAKEIWLENAEIYEAKARKAKK